MKKIWKRGLVVLCAVTMIAGIIQVSKDSVANAAETDPIQFGGTDTYLQMNNKLEATPEAVEATVNMTQAPKEWTLFEAEDMNVIGSDGTNEAATRFAVGTTEADTPLGEGVKYFQFTAGTNTVHTNQTKLGIQQTWYDQSDLAISFWCYNGGEAGDSLSDGQGQMRLSSYSADKDKNLLYKVMSEITLPNTGWNYIEIPLSEMGNANTNPEIGKFNVQNIQSFGFNNYQNRNGEERRFAEFKLIVLDKSVKWQAGYGFGTQISLDEVPDITNGPSASNNFYKLDAGTSFTYEWVNGKNQWLQIDASAYELSELALGVWCYNGNTIQEPFAFDDVVIGVSNNEWGLYTTGIRTQMKQYTLNPGWNYVEIPLATMQKHNGANPDFDIKNKIQSMTITWGGSGASNVYDNDSAFARYFTDFKLVVLDKERVEWQAGYGFGKQVSLNQVPDITNGPGASNNFYKLDAATSFTYEFVNGKNQWLQIDASAYELSELALGVWCYNGNSVSEPLAFDDVVIGVSNNEWGLYTTGIRTQMKQYTLNPGWNYVEIPLDTMQKHNEANPDFDIKNKIQSMTITWGGSGASNVYDNDSVYARYFTDFKLVTRTVREETVNATAMESNHMIVSNVNATGETAPYAVFVTGEGYPAVLYGEKQYTLTSNIKGKNTNLSVVRDTEGHIEFYLNGAFIAESESATIASGAPATAYCIGADGAGRQIMNGTISDLKIYSDTAKANCVADLPLKGDIQNVTATLTGLKYRGSRADDWSEYTTPTDTLGEDYWSMVFIPDIQNLTNADDYNTTWQTMATWIAENVDGERIKHVIGSGDSTWNNTDEQYQRAKDGYDKFANLVSWSALVGNHDYDWNKTDRDTSMYQKYFGEAALKSSASQKTYSGYYDDPEGKSTTENSYYRFNVNGVKWMVVQLEYHPRTGAIQWADSIIKAYPTDNVILATHGYINGWGQYIGEFMNCIPDNETGHITKTDAIWDELKDNENIQFILCGHEVNGTGAIVQKTETTEAGKEVPALMINAQDLDAGEGYRDGDSYFTNKPLGMLGILRFSADGTKMEVQYYSPSENKLFTPEDQMGNENSNSIEASLTLKTCEPIMKLYTEGFAAGTAPTEVPENYVFAGWFIDEDATQPLKADSEVSKAYARFVDKEVMNVKAQISANLIDSNTENDTAGSLRFVTTVDSLNYSKSGFYLEKDGKKVKVGSNQVYRTMKVLKEGTEETWDWTPKDFSAQSEYFKSFTLTGFGADQFDDEITATSYWITRDGTEVLGTTATKTINQGRGIRTVYVSAEGSDTNNGTKSSPYKTLNTALAAVDNGGTIRVDGTVSGDGWNAHNKNVVITGDTVEFKDNVIVNINDAVTFKNVTLAFNYANAESHVCANGNRVKIAADVTVTSAKPIQMYAGSHGADVASTDLTLLAGTYKRVYGGSYNGTVKGDTNVYIGGEANGTLNLADKNNMAQAIVYGGGWKGTVKGSTNVTIAGNAQFNGIYGGAYSGAVEGNTNVVVRDNVNSSLGTKATSTDHEQYAVIYGGSYVDNNGSGSVSGSTNVTVSGRAKAMRVFGGSYNIDTNGNAATVGNTNVLVKDNVELLSVYGGSNNGTNANTSVVMEGGTVQQIFGGSIGGDMTGNTDVRILGGTITRRVYGGCYNDYTLRGWQSSYSVNGYTSVTIAPEANVALNYSEDDRTLYAVSRINTNAATEKGIFILNSAENNGNASKLGQTDAKYIGLTGTSHHYLVNVSANGTVTTDVVEGSTVLRITPAQGYEIDAVTYGENTSITANADGTYNLPAARNTVVTIQVTFK